MALFNRLVTGSKLSGFPHAVDLYIPAGATRAVVFLHGGTGTNYLFANALGINLTASPPTKRSVDWTWLSKHKLMAVFPQGQALASSPRNTTWNNRVWTSGQDDVAFLQALRTHIRVSYGINAVSIAGHSNGGMMANRMWFESPQTFDKYVAVAGPASQYFMQRSLEGPPYQAIIGDQDTVIRTADFDAPTWTTAGSGPALVDAVVMGESFNVKGGLIRAVGAGHDIASIEQSLGTRVRDLIMAFVAQ